MPRSRVLITPANQPVVGQDLHLLRQQSYSRDKVGQGWHGLLMLYAPETASLGIYCRASPSSFLPVILVSLLYYES